MLKRWGRALHAELSPAGNVLRVLMKPRNGQPWSAEDRAFLKQELRAIAGWTPTLILIALPGSFLWLPLYAWLIDQRRGRAAEEQGRREADQAAAAARTDGVKPASS